MRRPAVKNDGGSGSGRMMRGRSSQRLGLLCAVALVAAACGSSSKTPSATPTTQAAGGGGTTAPTTAAGAANLNATLKISTTYPPISLDPTTVPAGVTPYQTMVFDRLINTDFNANLVPMLATSWNFSSDGMTLTLNLRQGVTFHTGNPVNAAAVVASLQHWKTAPKSLLAPSFADVISMVAVNPSTVQLHLSRPDASLPATLAGAAGIVVDPTAFTTTTNFATSPGMIGSGPWVVKSFIPDQSAVFVRAPGTYWDPKSAQLKEIDVDFTTDQSARLNAMQTGAADMAYINIGETFQTKSMTSSGNFTLNRLPSGLELALIMNQTRAPFTDPKVREALQEAINPDPIVTSLFQGDCTPTGGSIFLPGNWAYSKANNKYPYNLTAAKALLAQTSVPHGFTFTAITNAGGGDAEVAVVVQSDLAKIGVTMKIEPLATVAEGPLTAARNYQAEMGLLASAADPGLTLVQNFLLPGGNDIAGPDSAALQAIANQADSSTLTQSARAALYAQANQLIADSVWDVPLCYATTPWLGAKTVQGLANMNWIPNWDPRYLSKTS